MLALEEITAYLLDRKLISTADVVSSALAVSELNRRHCLFRVERETLPNYLIKQANAPGRFAALRHEAEVYALLSEPQDNGQHAVRLPRCFGYDGSRAMLILELFAGAPSLREHLWKGRRFSSRLGAKLGEILGQLHNYYPTGQGAESLPGDPHWALSAHRPDLDFFCDFSQATIQVVGVLQQSAELCALLAQAREGWRAEAMIHNDLRLDNVLVLDGQGRDLVLVDWELAAVGDPCWDVGSLFAEFLSFWLLSIPFAAATCPDEWGALALQPLDPMQPAIRTFWSSYLKFRGLDCSSARDALERSVRYAAARLVQGAIEQSQMASQPGAVAIICLQLALNILRQPERAASQLLGLSREQCGA
jgi:hypothetical protein